MLASISSVFFPCFPRVFRWYTVKPSHTFHLAKDTDAFGREKHSHESLARGIQSGLWKLTFFFFSFRRAWWCLELLASRHERDASLWQALAETHDCLLHKKCFNKKLALKHQAKEKRLIFHAFEVGVEQIPVDFHFRNAAIWVYDSGNLTSFVVFYVWPPGPNIQLASCPLKWRLWEIPWHWTWRKPFAHLRWVKQFFPSHRIWGVSRQTEHQGNAVQAKCMEPQGMLKNETHFSWHFSWHFEFYKATFYSKLRHLPWKLAGKQQCATTRLELFLSYTVTR